MKHVFISIIGLATIHCGSIDQVELDLEKAKAYLDTKTATCADIAAREITTEAKCDALKASDDPEDQKEVKNLTVIYNATLAKETLAKYFEEGTNENGNPSVGDGAIKGDAVNKDVITQRFLVVYYASSVLGTLGVRFSGFFDSFFTQSDDAQAWDTFANLLPDTLVDKDNFNETLFNTAIDNINNAQTVVDTFLSLHYTGGTTSETAQTQTADQITKGEAGELQLYSAFLASASFSLLTKKIQKLGKDAFTVENATQFLDNIDDAIDLLDQAGFGSESVNEILTLATSTLEDNPELVSNFLCERTACGT